MNIFRKKINTFLLVPLLLIFILISESGNAQGIVLSTPTTGDKTSSYSVTLAPGFSTSGPFRAYISPLVNTTSRGYITEEKIRIEGIKEDSQIYSLNAIQKQITKTFVDGFGRPIQQVLVKGSPLQKDIVQNIVYDNLGAQPKAYLPFTSSDGNGTYHGDAINEQASFYNNGITDKITDDTKPYSEQVFENSPLQRILLQGTVGNGFQPLEHASSLTYRTNVSSETVRRWNKDGTVASAYTEGNLSVTIATDPQGIQTMVYRDNAGNVVLKKQQLDGTIGGQSVAWLETYYVYDDLGLLRFVVPPKAVGIMQGLSNWSLSQTGLSKLLFRYSYDSKGRVIERTVPGSAVIYMIYDPLGRLALVQDGNLRAGNKWNYIKYDSRNVAISQGIYTNTTSTTRASMQTYVTGLDYGTYFEERNSTAGTGYYTNLCFPTADTNPLAYSYFNDYDLDGNGSADYSYVAQSLTGESAAVSNVRGMTTMVRKRTVGAGLADIWLTSVIFYDRKGNAIQTLSNNHLNTAVNNSKTVVSDFSGKVTRSKTVRVAASITTSVITDLGYDHMGRVLTIDEQVNGAASLRVAGYQYNELGQLIDKKLHSTNAGSSYLQSVDFRYSIRGQLLSINNSSLSIDTKNDDSNDVFGMEFIYDQADADLGNTAYFSGMLSAVKWRSKTPTAPSPEERSYKFSYDKAYRLTSALYADRTGSSWGNAGAYDEKDITYDYNGNILTLKRNAKVSGTISEIDNLNYAYGANELTNITDGTTAAHTGYGFRNLAASSTAYLYNTNGSLTNDYKKGLGLEYNVLNRTAKITLTGSTGRYIDYTYDASGVLLRKRAYDNNVIVKTTDYIEGFVYENNTLMQFAMAEGRVRNSSGTLKYEYMIADNMGNVRVSFEDVSGVATVRQENSYYPFGLIMPGGYAASQPNKNLYNGGSEWQDDFSNLPDYSQTFYRNYDAALGRFIAVDPMAESSESITTYHYALNNPIMFNDPLGDLAKGQTIYDIINMITTSGKYGGSWSSSDPDNVNIYSSNIDAFGGMAAFLTTTNGWGSTVAGSFDSGWYNLTNGKSASGSSTFGGEEGLGLKVVDISETRSNNNWLISRQQEAYNSNYKGDGVGQPGFGESLIPIWGSGRSAVDNFQNGNYWTGAAYTALAISDVFLVKAAATALAKGTITLAAKYVVRQAVKNPVLTIREAAAMANPRVAAMMAGKGIDRAFRGIAARNLILNPAEKMGLIKINSMTKGADMIGTGLLNGTWWDVTTRAAWGAHEAKYGVGGIGLFY